MRIWAAAQTAMCRVKSAQAHGSKVHLKGTHATCTLRKLEQARFASKRVREPRNSELSVGIMHAQQSQEQSQEQAGNGFSQ